MIQIFIRYDDQDKEDAERIKKGLTKMNFIKCLEEQDKDKINREIWTRE